MIYSLWRKNLQSLYYNKFTMKKEPAYFAKPTLWFVYYEETTCVFAKASLWYAHYEERICVFCKVYTMKSLLLRKKLCIL